MRIRINASMKPLRGDQLTEDRYAAVMKELHMAAAMSGFNLLVSEALLEEEGESGTRVVEPSPPAKLQAMVPGLLDIMNEYQDLTLSLFEMAKRQHEHKSFEEGCKDCDLLQISLEELGEVDEL